MHRNMQRCRLGSLRIRDGLLLVGLLRTFLRVFGSSAHGIDGGRCTSLMGPGSPAPRWRSMSGLL